MRTPRTTTTQILLCLNALLLLALLARTLLTPPAVAADQAQATPLQFEPGVYMLRAPDGSRQVYGRMAIDLRTGNIWGFPTLSQDPYPTNPVDQKPQVSRPFALGRFAVEDTMK